MRSRSFVVDLPVAQARRVLLERPELAPKGPLRAIERDDTIVIRLTRARPPYESHELMPQELHVELVHDRGHTRVTGRIRRRPGWRGITGSALLGLTYFGANWIADLSEWRDTVRRRAADRAQLLGLLAAAFGPHEVAEGAGPFR